MHLIITDAWLAKAKPIHLTGTKLAMVGSALALVFVLLAVAIYHWVFLTGARNGWPVVSQLVRLVTKDEAEQRERFVRENIQVLAKRVGETQGKLMEYESLVERVSGLAGLALPAATSASAPAVEIKSGGKSAQGGVILERPRSLGELQESLDAVEQLTGKRMDLLTLAESRLFEQRMRRSMLPTQQPVIQGSIGSAFGWRSNPFTGRSALHTGLDFQADPGTPILAAAGGIVVTQEWHNAYGNMVEIDHGNDLVTRYAHALRVNVQRGDVVKRGQKIAEVGSTGRSTGPHLHFEVLVQGVPQDPSKFLAANASLATVADAAAPAPRKAARR
jgi:murein DD-endopeptidase MepM/ murein hydrolase activator NlpD